MWAKETKCLCGCWASCIEKSEFIGYRRRMSFEYGGLSESAARDKYVILDNFIPYIKENERKEIHHL